MPSFCIFSRVNNNPSQLRLLAFLIYICEAIPGKNYKITRNCLAYVLNYFVMQMRKACREKRANTIYQSTEDSESHQDPNRKRRNETLAHFFSEEKRRSCEVSHVNIYRYWYSSSLAILLTSREMTESTSFMKPSYSSPFFKFNALIFATYLSTK